MKGGGQNEENEINDYCLCDPDPLMVGAGTAFSAASQTDCEALKAYVEGLTDVTFDKPVTNVTATWYPANPSPPFPAQPWPEYCQVTGWIWPEIQFQVSLPTSWNGRYINSGGGGWDGSLAGPLFDGLALGYATSGANGGYMGANWPADPGSFGLKEPYFSMYYNPDDYPTGLGGYYGDVSPKGEGNPYACQKVVDFGIRHLKETLLSQKRSSITITAAIQSTRILAGALAEAKRADQCAETLQPL